MDEKEFAQTRLGQGPQPGERYRHYKGGEYVIVCRSVDEATLEQLVTYRSLAKGGTWTRTLRNFTEAVPLDDSLSPKFAKRFERLA